MDFEGVDDLPHPELKIKKEDSVLQSYYRKKRVNSKSLYLLQAIIAPKWRIQRRASPGVCSRAIRFRWNSITP